MPPTKKTYLGKVCIGECFPIWVNLRDKLHLSNEALAKVLLEKYFERNKSICHQEVQTDKPELRTYSKPEKQNVIPSPRRYLAIESPIPITPKPTKSLTPMRSCSPSTPVSFKNKRIMPATPLKHSKNGLKRRRINFQGSKEIDFKETEFFPEEMDILPAMENISFDVELDNLDEEDEGEPLKFENTLDDPEEQIQVANIIPKTPEQTIMESHKKAKPVKNLLSAEKILEQEMVLVNLDLLTDLVKKAFGEKCTANFCKEPLEYRVRQQGSAVIYSWICSKSTGYKHTKGKWESQPMFYGLYSGNLILASCIPVSGNLYSKIAKFMSHSNVKFFGKDTYYNYQRHFIKPSVDIFWNQTQSDAFEKLAGKEVVLAGDGRNDSPGYTSMFCTYSLADIESKKILALNNRDVRHAAGKSPNMERIAFKLAAKDFVKLGQKFSVRVSEIVTDAHKQIQIYMRQSGTKESVFPYPVKHSWDIWHAGKNLLKKLTDLSLKKCYSVLAHWAPKVRNHFWYCAKMCDGNVKAMKELWMTILFHATNKHQWEMPKAGKLRCNHDPLTSAEIEEYPWLSRTEKPFRALRMAIMRPYLLKHMDYYVNFRHTGFLEAFHSLILAYAPKRIAFSYDGYEMRVKLAAIDHNFHTGRIQAKTKDGTLRDTRCYSKRTKAFYVVPLYEPKTYPYIKDLLQLIFEKRAAFEGKLRGIVPKTGDHPLLISKLRCMKEAPTKEELRVLQESRFSK